MMETIDQRVGIDRCEGALQTLFALTLMELADFEWRRPEGHGWEVGRWPGLRLTLLAQPESGPHRAHLPSVPNLVTIMRSPSFCLYRYATR
jgi:hypothetical protein